MRSVTLLALLSGLWIVGPDAGTPAPARPIRATLELTDGSVVYGTPLSTSLPIFADGSRQDVCLRRVRSLRFHEDHETATVTTWDGDELTGVPALEKMRIRTALGEVVIPSAATRRVSFSLGGIPLAEREYRQASGWSCPPLPEHRKPRRILGVERAPSEFLYAHASSRVVYEFDAPVTEFRAIAALYDGYGGTKGKVIFKVATDDDRVVYTSRPIRHFRKEDIYVKFPPTRRLILITDKNGRTWEDWSVWLHPEVR